MNSALPRALDTITIASPDPAQLEALFGTVLAWHCVARGAIDAALEKHWAITPGSAGSRYSLWQAGDIDRGRVRLISGGERQRVRPLTPRWSGIEMIVARDIDGLYARLASLPGLTTMQAPVTMDWSEFGSNQHRAFILRGPGGTHLAFTMGITQPVGREFPATAVWAGHVFELPLVTADFERARHFYSEVLGMTPILASQFERGLWHQIWKLPEPAAVRLDIVKGDAPGTGLGGLELTGYPAALIDVLPATRERFDAGTCLVTLTTTRLNEAYRRLAATSGARILSEPSALSATSYAGRRAFCFLGPDDERVELVEA